MEKTTEKYCRSLTRQRGGLLLKLSPFGLAGVPDRILLWPKDRVIFIEFKAPGKYPTPLQRYWHALLRHMGFRVEVCRSTADFYTLLDSLPKVDQTPSVT